MWAFFLQETVRCSDSIFQYEEPTEAQLDRFPRPADERNTNPIIDYAGIGISSEEMLLIKRVNASLGKTAEIHNIIMIFDASIDTQSVVTDALTAWQGTNKNELVTFVGIDKGTKEIKWIEVKSWADDTKIHSIVKNELIEKGKYDTQHVASTLLESVPKYWERKEFEDLEYIKIQIHYGWYLGHLFTILTFSVIATIVMTKAKEVK